MAIQPLLILYGVIAFSFIITSIFMFKPKSDETVHIIFFWLAVALASLATFINATAIPAGESSCVVRPFACRCGHHRQNDCRQNKCGGKHTRYAQHCLCLRLLFYILIFYVLAKKVNNVNVRFVIHHSCAHRVLNLVENDF